MKKSNKFNDQKKDLFAGLLQNFLVSVPAIIGFAIFVMSKGDPLLFSLGAFIAGFTGIIVIIKKESSTAVTNIRGKIAIIEGALVTLVLWGSSIILLIEYWKNNH